MSVTLLDVVLVLVLITFVIAGFMRGVWVTIGSAAGFLVGAVAAFFAIPLVSSWVPDPVWRIVAVVAAVLILVTAGHAVGSAAGAEIKRSLMRTSALRAVGSVFGAAVNLVVAVVVIAALTFSVQAMGLPTVNQQIRESAVLQTMDRVLPEQVEAWFAEVRSLVMASEIPEIAQPLVPEPTETPEQGELTEAAAATAGSVGRISGVAQQCGQTQSGSGFVVSPTRVMTNAHVVAGVGEPTVQMPDGQLETGRVVHFDTTTDVALLAVDPINAAPVTVGEPLDVGQDAYVMGYPAGGPFKASSALVQARGVTAINDIYGNMGGELEIYQVNADVRQGNSGGPLVAPDGTTVGVVFARAMGESAAGFAVTAEAVGDPLTSPDAYTETVSTGQCVSD